MVGKIIKKSKRIFTRVFHALVDGQELIRLIEKQKKDELYLHVTAGSGTQFYRETKIENLQRNKSKIVIGTNSHIRGNLLIWPYGNGIQIGNNSFVGEGARIWAGDNVLIGNGVLIAHNVTIIDSDSHELDYLEREQSFIKLTTDGHPKDLGSVKTSPIVIEDNVWISYNSCILKGVKIGKGAIVGAGSVVSKDVPPFTIVAGNPAVIIRTINTGNDI
ncbi:acyltransferase [Dyadobacter alkalitolerans]|uniref:acyltransferase n=1 Tax=Dyadobacter alkalitolerans TaxID=492736 RepID=UPI000424A59E|nr:acyltransferase [Dyadobacter alkalitolerans]